MAGVRGQGLSTMGANRKPTVGRTSDRKTLEMNGPLSLLFTTDNKDTGTPNILLFPLNSTARGTARAKWP